LPLFTDLTEIAVRESGFPGLRRLDLSRGLTLQDLLSATSALANPQAKLEMLPPK
jgi:hypothetical protein